MPAGLPGMEVRGARPSAIRCRVRPEREDTGIRDPVIPPDHPGGSPAGGSSGLPRLPQLPQLPTKGKLTVLPAGPRPAPDRAPGETAIDPVCGMTVDPRTAAGSYVHGGRTYWFCATGCLERFRADPERYLAWRALRDSRPRPDRRRAPR
jgi:YHS domain-containing protein